MSIENLGSLIWSHDLLYTHTTSYKYDPFDGSKVNSQRRPEKTTSYSYHQLRMKYLRSLLPQPCRRRVARRILNGQLKVVISYKVTGCRGNRKAACPPNTRNEYI